MATPSTGDCNRARRSPRPPARPRPSRSDSLSRVLAEYVAAELAARRTGTWL